MHKLLQSSETESMSAVSNIFVGHTEAPLVVRPYLANMSQSELFAVMTGGCATIAGAVMAGCAAMGVDLKYLITASFMAAPGGLLMAKMMMPETKTSNVKFDPNETGGEAKPVNIFEAVRQIGINPWIQIAGSSEEYGMVYENELPIKETNPLRPLSPYAVSKVTQDLLGYQYFMSYELNIVRTRGFNHTGPRRPAVFVCSDFARQIVEIEKDLCEPIIYVGSLEAERDFTDVRDTIRGYWLALEKGIPGEVYNICSGRGYKIGEILDMLLGMTSNHIKVKKDSARMRPSDVPVLVGDSAKFRKQTGWKAKIPFEKKQYTELRLVSLIYKWRLSPLITLNRQL